MLAKWTIIGYFISSGYVVNPLQWVPRYRWIEVIKYGLGGKRISEIVTIPDFFCFTRLDVAMNTGSTIQYYEWTLLSIHLTKNMVTSCNGMEVIPKTNLYSKTISTACAIEIGITRCFHLQNKEVDIWQRCEWSLNTPARTSLGVT